MPLANVLKPAKRFLYLDEFSCVEYASPPARYPTIPVSTMLKLLGGQALEIQVSQSFHDGNPDARWQRGVAVTSKLNGLWDPRGCVTAEDVKHLQNRVEQFVATATLPRGELKMVQPCGHHFCKWLVEASVRFAGKLGAQPVDGGAPACEHDGGVAGLVEFCQKANLPPDACQKLRAEIAALGAVHVSELTAEDWSNLCSFQGQLPLQRGRILATVQGAV